MKIGVFDSGLGGLTVVKEIRKMVSHVDIVYVGDNKNVPYGLKTKEELRGFVKNILDFLEDEGVDLIVVACNTVTAMLLEEMKEEYDTPMIGVIEAGSSLALRYAKKGIGVIATYNTIASKGYEIEIGKRSDIDTYGLACHELVNEIEKELGTKYDLKRIVEKELQNLPLSHIDTLILGCTHYPLVEREIQTVVGNDILLVNPATEVAKEILYHAANGSKGEGKTVLYTSGCAKDFEEKVKHILGIRTNVHTFFHKTKSF